MAPVEAENAPSSSYSEPDVAVQSGGGMVDLNEVAGSVLEILREDAEDHGIAFEHELTDGPLGVQGSRTGFRQPKYSAAGQRARRTPTT